MAKFTYCLAVRNLHISVVNLLMGSGADVNTRDILRQKFISHFASGLYSRYKKLTREAVEYITMLGADLPSDQSLKKQIFPELNPVLNSKGNLFVESETDKLINVNGFKTIVDYYNDLQRLVIKLVESAEKAYKEKFGKKTVSVSAIETVQNQILDSINKITTDQQSDI